MYDLRPNNVKEVLDEKGIDILYHANSVQTACTFLSNGGLLSREAVEVRGLLQTSQKTDELDKKYGIWNDIFLDSCDIHERSNNINYYGPVLFKIDSNILKQPHIPYMRITKKNPQYWDGNMEQEDKYFVDLDEVKQYFHYGDFAQMLTLRETQEVLSFNDSLLEIIVDDPQKTLNGVNIYDQAVNALYTATLHGGIDVPIIRRNCGFACNCSFIYGNRQPYWFKKYYLPQLSGLRRG